ncbi:MAG: hypothetical protein ABSA45_08260 [Verrucomicrobiota bacterium]|jgi:hypothetical protein
MNQNQKEIIVGKNGTLSSPITHRTRLVTFAGLSLNLAAALLGSSVLAANTNLTWNADFTLKETYDDNVYIEDIKPIAANVNAAEAAGLHPVQAGKSSFVTTLVPRFGLNYEPCSGFKVTVGYAPEIALYTSAEDEDYIAHRATLNFSGKIKDATWELLNSPAFIEGSTIGPVFARPEDVPAIGGIPLRDRREQFVFRNGFRLTLPFGRWFIRPVAASYYHDFLTDQRLNTDPAYSYENYLDRQDVNGGVDVGYDVGKKTFLTLGYRYGRQDQFVGPNANNTAFTDSPYDSSYHRILAGVEGSPVKWLKLNVQLGPEFRRFDPGTAAGFDRSEVLCYADASATVIPTRADTVNLRWTRFEQPAFSSQSVYEDIKYDLTWRHKFSDQFTAGAGFTVYVGDWQTPVNRNDWIYTPSAMASYAFNKHLSAEFNCSCDLVQSKVSTSAPGATYADGREFSRNLVSLAVKYVF